MFSVAVAAWIRSQFRSPSAPLGALTATTSAGVLLYAGLGVVCLMLGANYLDYAALPVSDARSVGMLLIEIAVGITVTAAIISIFHDLVTFE